MSCLLSERNSRYLRNSQGLYSHHIQVEVVRVSLFASSSQAVCPDISEAKFYWLTDKTGTGPGFSENFLGFLATVGNLAMLAGVLAYNWYLKDQPFRRVFLWAQVSSQTSVPHLRQSDDAM